MGNSLSMKPCPFCGEELKMIERWDESRRAPAHKATDRRDHTRGALQHEIHHPDNGCVLRWLGGGEWRFLTDAAKDYWVTLWNQREAGNESTDVLHSGGAHDTTGAMGQGGGKA